MNPRDSIVTRLRRAIPSSWVPFPCPLCARPIEIPRRDFGADLHCPHCTAWIAAPNPTTGQPAAIRDPRVLEAVQFQKSHAVGLADLKEGVLARSNRREIPPLPSEPNAQVPPGRLDPAHASNQLRHETPAHDQLHAIAAAIPTAQPRLRPSIEPSLSFRPAEALTPPHNSPDAIPEWDRELGKAYPVPQPGIHLSTATKIAWFVSSSLAIIAVGLLVHRDLETRTARADAERHRIAQLAVKEEALLQHQQAQSRRADAAIATARSALGAATWTEALPHVRHAARVSPLMERWHATHPWTPMNFTPIDEGKIQEQADHTFFILTARDETKKVHVFGLEETPSGWKFDWEVFTDRAQHEWLDFFEARPATPQPLRVGVIRRTPTFAMLEAAGMNSDETFTVMLYGPNIAQGSVFAVLEADSAIAAQLAREITFDESRRFILELAFLPVDPGLPDNLVKVHRILETGWTYLK